MPAAPALTFATDIEVRFSDLDAYGHVNNAVFFTYFETARVRLFLEKFADFFNDGLLFLVAKAECRYKRPIELTDRVVVVTSVARVGNASFDLSYEVNNGAGIVFATAQTAMVCFDPNLKRPTPLPAPLARALGGG